MLQYVKISQLPGAVALSQNALLEVVDGGINQKAIPSLVVAASVAAAGILAVTAPDAVAARTLTGTANQVIVANGDGVAGNPVFSLPQSIAPASSPTFAGLTISGSATIPTLNGSVGVGGNLAVGGNLSVVGDITLDDITLDQLTVNGLAMFNGPITGAGNILSLRNGVSGQTIHLYETFIDAGNYERLGISASAGTPAILTEQAGTGGVSALRIGTTGNAGLILRTNNTDRITLSGAGHLVPDVDNASDLGNGTNRFRDAYFSRNLQVDGDYRGSDGSAGNPTYTFTAEQTTGMYRNAASGNIVFSVVGNVQVGVATNALLVEDSAALGWCTNVSTLNVPDLALWRDAANVLGQRNGTTAQEHRVYRTFTDASNYERLTLHANWSGTRWGIVTEAGGTGAGRSLDIGAGTGGNLGLISDGTQYWVVTTSGGFTTTTDNAYDIGASGTGRPRDLFLGRSIAAPGDALFNTFNGNNWVIVGDTISQTFSASYAPRLQIHGNTTQRSSLSLSNWVNSAALATLAFTKSRGTTVGAQGAVLSGDSIGDIRWYASDGVAFDDVAKIDVVATENHGPAANGTAMLFYATPNGSINRGTVLVIGSSNFSTSPLVGVGIPFTASSLPAAMLHVAGNSASDARSTARFQFNGNSGNDFELEFYKGRGSYAAPSVITSGDDLGTISGYGYVGPNNTYIQAIRLVMDSEGAINDAPGGLGGTYFIQTRPSGGNLTEQFRIAGSGLLTTRDHQVFGALSWASAYNGTADVSLFRDAANVLAQRNGTSAQTFRLYNTYTDGSNYERLETAWSGNVASILTQQAGTGSARGLIVGTSGANTLTLRTNGTNRWQVDASGNLIGATDGSYDIGAVGANRPRDLYLGRDLHVAGNATIGNNASDQLAIIAGTWTLGSNFAATRAAGTLPAGTTNLIQWNATYTGDSGGTSDARVHNFNATASGGNAFTGSRAVAITLSHGGTALISTGQSVLSQLSVNSTGGFTTHHLYNTFANLAGGGAVGSLNYFHAEAPNISSGSITTVRALRVNNLGNPNVTTAIGVSIADFSGATTMRGIQSSLSAGTGKHNLYIDGTAVNLLTGRTDFGGGISSNGAINISFYTDNGAAEQFRVIHTASAVNYMQVQGRATGNNAIVSVNGSDTNIGISFIGKGTGSLRFSTNSSEANEQFRIANTASAVNYLQVTGSTTGTRPILTAQGSDTNTGIVIAAKGTGHIGFYSGGGSRLNVNIIDVASSVNYIEFAGAATGSGVEVRARGSDADIDLKLEPKGSGRVRFGTHSALAAETVTGYITIKDSAGNDRKLAVVS